MDDRIVPLDAEANGELAHLGHPVDPQTYGQGHRIVAAGRPVDGGIGSHPDLNGVGDVVVDKVLNVRQVGVLPGAVARIGPPMLGEQAQGPFLPDIGCHPRRSRLKLALPQDVFAGRRKDEGRPQAPDEDPRADLVGLFRRQQADIGEIPEARRPSEGVPERGEQGRLLADLRRTHPDQFTDLPLKRHTDHGYNRTIDQIPRFADRDRKGWDEFIGIGIDAPVDMGPLELGPVELVGDKDETADGIVHHLGNLGLGGLAASLDDLLEIDIDAARQFLALVGYHRLFLSGALGRPRCSLSGPGEVRDQQQRRQEQRDGGSAPEEGAAGLDRTNPEPFSADKMKFHGLLLS